MNSSTKKEGIVKYKTSEKKKRRKTEAVLKKKKKKLQKLKKFLKKENINKEWKRKPSLKDSMSQMGELSLLWRAKFNKM